jgi:hypothetical protein
VNLTARAHVTEGAREEPVRVSTMLAERAHKPEIRRENGERGSTGCDGSRGGKSELGRNGEFRPRHRVFLSFLLLFYFMFPILHFYFISNLNLSLI